MAFDEYLAERVRTALHERKVLFEEKRMFGGIGFMVDDKLCLGVMKNELMVRISEEDALVELQKEGVKPMDESGKSMRGFIMVESFAIDMEDDFEHFVNLSIKFNPLAQKSKKRR